MPFRIVESDESDSEYEPESEAEEDPISEAVGELVTAAHVRLKLKSHPTKAFLSKRYYHLVKKAEPETNLQCPICLEDICCPDCFELWSCGHFLHRHCSAELEAPRCPLCR